MKNNLHPSPESFIGYWLLYREFIVIRVYGFTGTPSKFPALLNPRNFAFEFIKKILCSDEDNFGALMKCYDVKFPFKIGPFIFKSKTALPIVEKLLEAMDFQKMERLNYDLWKIISQRRQQNKNKAFEHQLLEGMDKMDNLLERYSKGR